MIYGYSGYGAQGGYGSLGQFAKTTTTTAFRTISPVTRAVVDPVASACGRLRQKLAADAATDPMKLCTGGLWAGSCAAKQVETTASPFRKAVRTEIGTLAKTGGAALASQLVYCLAASIAAQSDMPAQTALLHLRADYLKTVGSYPLSQDQAAAQSGTTKISLPTGTAIYGGAAAEAGRPIPGGGTGPSAETEQPVTGGGAPSDVFLPPPTAGEACLAQGGQWDPTTATCVMPGGIPPTTEKKAMWPWLLGGAVVLGGGLWFIAAKKRRKK